MYTYLKTHVFLLYICLYFFDSKYNSTILTLLVEFFFNIFPLFYKLFKVMFKVRQARATPPPPPQRRRIRRTSSRRSGYAFSHAQGYGDLVTSGRFLLRPAVSRSTGFPGMGRTTSGFSPMGRSAGYSPTERPLNSKVPHVEVTSLQMYRTIRDPAL